MVARARLADDQVAASNRDLGLAPFVHPGGDARVGLAVNLPHDDGRQLLGRRAWVRAGAHQPREQPPDGKHRDGLLPILAQRAANPDACRPRFPHDGGGQHKVEHFAHGNALDGQSDGAGGEVPLVLGNICVNGDLQARRLPLEVGQETRQGRIAAVDADGRGQQAPRFGERVGRRRAARGRAGAGRRCALGGRCGCGVRSAAEACAEDAQRQRGRGPGQEHRNDRQRLPLHGFPRLLRNAWRTV
ncbi:MAG: hypothetical protein FJ288_13435 [Planctomycetes bacterium]|nr:hypothetical protein [Planctomycetota bacterium]